MLTLAGWAVGLCRHAGGLRQQALPLLSWQLLRYRNFTIVRH